MTPAEACRHGFRTRLVVCGAALGALCLASLWVGTTPLRPRDVVEGLLGRHANPDVTLIVRYGRLPRLVLSLTVGGALAAAGLLMQTLCRNPLATPAVLGIGNGANLGLLIAIIWQPNLGEPLAVLASFAGATLSAGAIALMGLSPPSRMDRDRLIIGGTILGALEGSLLIAILFLWGMNNVMLGWTLGRLVQVDWAQIVLTLPLIALALAGAMAVIRQLDSFQLGDAVAASLGVRVGLIRAGTLLVIVLLAGAAVAAAGPVPYVGLIVPHVFPRRQTPDPHARLLLCVLGGALLTGAAELLARLTSQRQLVPLGIWTMAAGAAFFLALSLTRRGQTA